VRERARIVAAAMLEVSADDPEWEKGRWFVRGDPDQGKTITEIALAAHSTVELPEGVEGQLDATCVYNPPNLTYPYGAYICVVDVDQSTGKVSVRRFIAVDDCGVRINPMIVEGQVHGGLADGVGMALMEVIAFDDEHKMLTAALNTGVPYIGLVASRRRGAAVLDSLGLDPEKRARVHTPAGLDIGAQSPGEVALSIMAEIIALLARGDTPPNPPHGGLRAPHAPAGGDQSPQGSDGPRLRHDGRHHGVGGPAWYRRGHVLLLLPELSRCVRS
jgi:hypothetical protein